MSLRKSIRRKKLDTNVMWLSFMRKPCKKLKAKILNCKDDETREKKMKIVNQFHVD